MVKVIVLIPDGTKAILTPVIGGWECTWKGKTSRVDKISTGNVIARGTVFFVRLVEFHVREILEVIA